MTTNINTQISDLRRDVVATFPNGTARKLSNLLDRFQLTVKRHEKKNGPTDKQIEDRYIANKTILEAMIQGRHVSCLDDREFKASEMHTQIHTIRRKIDKLGLPYVLKDKWIPCGTAGKRCKEYWLEKKEEQSL